MKTKSKDNITAKEIPVEENPITQPARKAVSKASYKLEIALYVVL